MGTWTQFSLLPGLQMGTRTSPLIPNASNLHSSISDLLALDLQPVQISSLRRSQRLWDRGVWSPEPFHLDVEHHLARRAGILNNTQLPEPMPLRFGDLIPVIKENDHQLKTDVANFSSTPLSAQQIDVLNLCVKYQETPQHLPYLQFMASKKVLLVRWIRLILAKGLSFDQLVFKCWKGPKSQSRI